MSSSNCCFLTCIQISQEADQVVWYSHLLKNSFLHFVVIHTVKGSGIVNKAKIDVFLELSCFFHDPADVGNLVSGAQKGTPGRSLWSTEGLRNLFASQEATVKTGHGTTDWFQIGKGVHRSCILSPCLFNLYAEDIMRNAGLEDAQAGIKIAGRNINNLRYADDTTLMEKVKN